MNCRPQQSCRLQAIQDQKQAMIEDLEDKIQHLLRENSDLKVANAQAEEDAERAAVAHQCEA